VEKEKMTGADAAEDVVLKVAKNLQSSFSRQTAGEPRKWQEVPPEEKKMWIRLARTARKVVVEAEAPGASA
jgi:hypothetical protein